MNNWRHRLTAAYDLVRGRVPQGMAVTNPFFYGKLANYRGNGKGNVTPPLDRYSIDRLRRFSETSIPRRFVNYYRNQIAMLDWWIVPKDGAEPNQTQRKRMRQATKLLEQPNADMNWNTFIEQVVEEMCVPGVAPIEVKTLRPRERRDINDDLTDAPNHMLYPFDGSSLSYYTDWDGSPSSPRYAQMLPDGNVVDFRNSQLLPWRYGSRATTPHGLSPMDVAMQDIEQFLDSGVFAGRTASNAQAKKALFLKNATDEQINDLRAYWRNEIEGSGSMPILGGEDGTTLELGLITDQNLFLGWQEFKIAVIASAFGIDVTKANIIAGVNRSTGDTMSQTTDEGAIKPLADMIAQYINQYVLTLYGLSDVCEFRFIYTAISDQKAIATVNQVETQDDNATLDECRFRQGKPPLLHPITGERIGNVTVSFYREMIKVPGFTSRGLKALEEYAEQQRKLAETKLTTAPTDNGGDGSNGLNDNPDESQRGGNGVYSAPKPKEKAMNQRNDADLDMA